MEWPVKQADNYGQEKQNANYPMIRHFYVQHDLALTPQTDLKTGDWKVCSSETVGDFTAVGFFFARELAQKLKIPVGLLHSSWGGSQAEGWISKEGMLTNEELRPVAQTLPTTWAKADSLIDAKLRRQLLRQGKLQPTVQDEARYVSADYDISGWQKADPFGQWDWKGMYGFRGQGYMARQIEIPSDMLTAQTTLALAENDSPNQIYINGKLVSEGVLNGVRKITLPPNTWKPGSNLVMIKFGNATKLPWFGLGLQGSASDLYVEGPSGRTSLAGEWRIMPSFAESHTYTRFMNNLATGLYNGMIYPLLPFGIRGVLWYQGETNAGRAYQYRQTFPLLITDWRQKWGYEFPFYFVQLSSYGPNQNSNQGSDWAELREAQTMTLSLPKTGMAVTTDVGNPKDIHPTNKQDVGRRLAAIALKQDYGKEGPDGSPMYESVAYDGGKATVSFRNAGSGLMTNDKYGYVKGFEIAGDDKKFYYAKADIQGDKVVLSHPSVPKPVAVRYGWANAPEDANLFDTEGFPVSPFRTDTWPGITLKTKFE